MKYESLKALFYQDPENFDKNYQLRFNNSLAIKTGLQIYPYDKRHHKRINQSYELFYMPNAELAVLIEDVFQNTKKLNELDLNYPKLQKSNFLLLI